MSKTSNPKEESFLFEKEVKERKDHALKLRLQTLIANKGMSESDFYNNLQISRQYWWALSWGVWETPLDLKIKIAKTLETDSALIWQEERR